MQQLEAASVRARAQRTPADREAAYESLRNKIKLFLELRGVEQSPKESLMEAWARALEMSCREVRALLKSGVSPIRKYFEDHGVFEGIERRKAAGTWPSG